MAVKKVLGWGECVGQNTVNGSVESSYDDIVENSASLSVEEGQEQEANIEGGKAEGRKQLPDKYIIEFDRRIGDENEVQVGFVEDAGDIAIIPKNIGAVYAELKACSRKITLKQDTTDGLVAHYYYKTKGSTDSDGNLDDVDIKKHTSATMEYSAVSTSITGYSGKNPKQEGWYIKNGSSYIHSWDTTPQEGMTYYELATVQQG